MPNKKKKLVLLFFSFLVVVIFLIWSAVISVWGEEEKIVVNFLDVGQGDSILIQTPKGEILIDGGPDNSALQEIGKIMPFFDRQIEIVILTHPDNDHLNGLVEIAKRYEIETIIETGIPADNSVYQEWTEILEGKNINRLNPQIGYKIDLGDNAFLEIIWPPAGYSSSNLNDTSIITLLDWNETEVMFTGDVEIEVLDKLAIDNQGLDIEILKQPHHGSKTGISESLISSFKPEYSVISVGAKNRYGHPHQETLDLLAKYGVKILRTDELGTIKAVINKDSYQI